ncbi:MAG: histidine phosphatase family protein [Lachnospiraceae bacterium]|nr:histidine phosphatase family protein [Lachnospiraceae bacterium]
MAKIYLIRHCESEGNACRRTQAHVDALVTVKGYAQSEMLRRRFKDIPIDAIYSSDSYRSIMTVDPIARERGMKVKVRILLRELTTGIWEDGAWGNIALEYPEDHYNWANEPWNMTCPGCSTFQQISDRLLFGLRRIAKEVGKDGTALAVSHSCSIKAALCTIQGLPMTDVLKFGHGDNTSVSLLHVDEDGNFSIEFMNDESHLPDDLKRAWPGMAGSAINMDVYPVTTQKQMEELLQLAEMDFKERGEAFDREAYRRDAEALLKEHPDYIALSHLQGKLTGYVRLGFDANLPSDCGLLEHMYIVPDMQGIGYCEQLFGYAAHIFRYEDLERLAMPKACSKEEQRVVDRFVFHNMNGLREYYELNLYTPISAYHLLA